MEAISHAGAAVGIRTNSGVVLAAEKKILSKVPLEASSGTLERIFFSAARTTPELVRIPTAAPAWLIASMAYSTFT